MELDLSCTEVYEADLDRIVTFYMTYYNSYEGGQWSRQTTYKRIHQVWGREDSLCLLLEHDNTLVGFSMGYFEQYDDIQAFDLVEILIDKDYQNRGVGTWFMRQIESKVKEQGGAMIQLDAVNDDSHNRFYGKLGFQKCTNLIPMSKWL